MTVAVNPTPRRDGRPARLLDMVEGRSGRAFADLCLFNGIVAG